MSAVGRTVARQRGMGCGARRGWFGCALLLVVLAAGPVCAGAQTPAHDLVKRTSEQVLAALRERADELKQDPDKIYGFVEEYLLPHFDFERMSQLVLGKYWRRATPEERRQFIEEFRLLLVRTYATAMLKYSDQEIVYLPYHGEPDADEVTVETEVEQPGLSPIPIDYKLYRRDGAWKVYDVSIDNVSLVVNYRGTFASEIRRTGGVAGLIEKLRERNRRVTSG